MKKIFLAIMAFAAVVSCTNEKEQVCNTYVLCRFNASALNADSSDEPLTKSSPRKIYYAFTDASGEIVSVGGDNASGTVFEGDYVEVMLPTNTPIKHSWASTDKDVDSHKLIIESGNNFHFTSTINITEPINESVILKRVSSKLAVKRGKIPQNTTLDIQTTITNGFDWVLGSQTYKANDYIENVTISEYWLYGDSPNNATVTAKLKNSNGKVIKEGTYTYTVAANTIKTVVFNMDASGSGSGFITSIDDTPMIQEDDEHQQIGK